jgi:tetratricopeptide (TPR) repeat protein
MRQAAAQALEGNDFAAAVERAETALTLAPDAEPGEANRILAEAHKWRGANADGLRAARAAMTQLPVGSPPWCTAAGELSATAAKLGDTAALLALAADLHAATTEDPRSGPLMICLARTCASLLMLGHEAATALYDRLPVDTSDYPPGVIARIEMVRAVRVIMSGDVAEFLLRSQACVTWYESAGDFRGALGPRANLGFGLIELGAYAEAEKVLRDALASSRRLGLQSVTGGALQNLGWALARQGKLDEARDVETQAVADFQAQGARYYEGGARIYLGRIHAARGDTAAGEAELVRAVELLAISPSLRCCALGTLADLLLAAGRVDEALARAREAMTTLREVGEVNEGDSLVRLVHARALRAAGLDAEADEAAASARARLLERAAKISDPTRRAQFLEVEENAATLALS